MSSQPVHLEANRTLHARGWLVPAILLAAAPVLLVLVFVARVSVPVPVVDEWYLVDLVGKLKHGQVTFHDYFIHTINEHRVPVPKLLFCLNVLVAGWNLHWRNYLSVLLVLASWAVLLKMAWEARPADEEGSFRISSLFVICVLMFSLAQGESWMDGILSGWFLVNFCVIAGAALILRAPPGKLPARAFLAAALAALASFCFIHGLMAWVVLSLLLLIRAWPERGIRWKTLLPWAALALFCALFYSVGYHRLRQGGSYQETSSLFQWLGFLSCLAGNVLSSDHPASVFAAGLLLVTSLLLGPFLFQRARPRSGPPDAAFKYRLGLSAGLVLLLLCGMFYESFLLRTQYSQSVISSLFIGLPLLISFPVLAWDALTKGNKERQEQSLVWCVVGLFSLLFCVLATIGRVGFGLEYAVHSRYATGSLFVAVAVVQLWRLKLLKYVESQPGTLQVQMAQALYGGFLAAIGVLLAINSWSQYQKSRALAKSMQCGLDGLRVVRYLEPVEGISQCVENLLNQAGVIRKSALTMERLGYRGLAREVSFVRSGPGSPGSLQGLEGRFKVAAYGRLKLKPGEGGMVLLSYGEQPSFFASFCVEPSSRPPAASQGTLWQFEFDRRALPHHVLRVHAWTFDEKKNSFIELAPPKGRAPVLEALP